MKIEEHINFYNNQIVNYMMQIIILSNKNSFYYPNL